MHNPIHHISLRKRKKLEPYPSPDMRVRIMDKLIIVVGVLSPLMTVPQIYDIYVFKNASGVSTISWFSYTIFSVVWVIYGIMHKEKAIILSQSIWIVMGAAVWLGAYIYG